MIYRLEGRAIWTVFNEKVLAGLGRDLPRTGRLSPEGVEVALTALRRFRALLDGLPRRGRLRRRHRRRARGRRRRGVRARVAAETGLDGARARPARRRRATPRWACSPARPTPRAWSATSAAPAWSWSGSRPAGRAGASPCRWAPFRSARAGRFDPGRVRTRGATDSAAASRAVTRPTPSTPSAAPGATWRCCR